MCPHEQRLRRRFHRAIRREHSFRDARVAVYAVGLHEAARLNLRVRATISRIAALVIDDVDGDFQASMSTGRTLT